MEKSQLLNLPIDSVKLISHTQPVPELQKLIEHEVRNSNSLLELVAYCARVSNPSSQMNFEKSEKLVKYLIKHKHWSPLEMVDATMEIEGPRDILRQILRHRSFCFQEFSQRYANPLYDMKFVLREARFQDPKNRQNSIDDVPHEIQNVWQEKQQKVIDAARDAYAWAIQQGIAKECARVVLPEGNTMSRIYMKGSLRSWIHYIELRGANGTQKEHMMIAHRCALVLNEIFPMEIMNG